MQLCCIFQLLLPSYDEGLECATCWSSNLSLYWRLQELPEHRSYASPSFLTTPFILLEMRLTWLLGVNPPCEGALYWKRERERERAVKQEILIKTGKQNRRCIVVLHTTEFHSLQKYQSHDKTSSFTTLSLKISYKKANALRTSLSRRRYSYPTVVVFLSLLGPLWVLSQPCRSCSCVVSCRVFMKLFYEQIKWWWWVKT